MIIRLILPGLLLTFMPLRSTAQAWMIEGGIGMAINRMDDLNYYLEEMVKDYPPGITGKVVSSFPSFMTGSLRIGKEIVPSIWLGAGYAYTSTGGRANYTDYSGSISTDMRAGSHRLGARLAYRILTGEAYDVSVYGGVGLNYTRLEVTTSLTVLGYADAINDTYRSATLCGSAGLQFYYHFNSVSVGAEAGYLVDKPGDLSSVDNGADLTDPNDQRRTLTSDWTGLRVQLKLAFSL